MTKEKRPGATQNSLYFDLRNAIRENTLQAAVDALHAGADPNMIGASENGLLYYAAQKNNIPMMDLLWSAGATFLRKEVTQFQNIQEATESGPDVTAHKQRKHVTSLSKVSGLKDDSGFQHLYALARGDVEITPAYLQEAYGITFDPKRHVDAVRTSPIASANLTTGPDGDVHRRSEIYLKSIKEFGRLAPEGNSIKK